MAATRKGRTKRILWIVVFLVALFGVKTLKEYWTDEKARAAVEQGMNQLRQDAVNNHPETTVSEAMTQEATKKLAELDAAQGGDSAKLAGIAAHRFWAFLFLNTRTRSDYCRELGVDISAFTSAFDNLHRKELERASAILAKEGSDKEKLYALHKVEARKVMEHQMQETAKMHNVKPRDLCNEFAERGEEFAEMMQLSKTRPEVHQALLAPQ